MHRPLPIHPRGPRRPRARRDEVLLACPRVSPEWELGALRALMKPQARGVIEHRRGEQAWPAGAEEVVREAAAAVEGRIGGGVEIHFPDAGDYLLAAKVPGERSVEGMALAVVLSARLPELWFVLGRLYVRGGKFFRRERGYKLKIVEASNVHLPRGVRAALRGLVY